MYDPQIWNLIVETWRAIKDSFQPAVHPFAEENGLVFRDFGMLLAVRYFEPESATPAHFMVRDPFTAAEAFLERLQNLVAMSFLSQVGAGKFELTKEGNNVTQRFIDISRQAMVEIEPLTERDGDRLADLLEVLVEASLNVAPPPSTWSIQLSHKLMPAKSPPLPYIEQAMTCLSAFRDDSHLAAWRLSGLSATALEVLTLVWRGTVGSYEDICDRLAYRGHACTVYEDVLYDLRARGYIDGPNSELKISVKGRLIRNEIEENTNRYFFSPWVILKQPDTAILEELLLKLKSGLVG